MLDKVANRPFLNLIHFQNLLFCLYLNKCLNLVFKLWNQCFLTSNVALKLLMRFSYLASLSWNLEDWKVQLRKWKPSSQQNRYFYCLSDSLFYGTKFVFRILFWIFDWRHQIGIWERFIHLRIGIVQSRFLQDTWSFLWKIVWNSILSLIKFKTFLKNIWVNLNLETLNTQLRPIT